MNLSAEAILFLPVLLFSISLHEFGHAYAALKGGDDTAFHAGRVTLNPIAHIDPIGTVLLPIMQLFMGVPLFGWAKPVPVLSRRLKNAQWDLIVSLAGVSLNLTLAAAALVAMKIGVVAGQFPAAPDSVPGMILTILRGLVLINVVLAVFNLIPIPPLDGSHVLLHFIRTRDSFAFQVFRFLERFGFVLLLLLLISGALAYVVGPPLLVLRFLATGILGIPPEVLGLG